MRVVICWGVCAGIPIYGKGKYYVRALNMWAPCGGHFVNWLFGDSH